MSLLRLRCAVVFVFSCPLLFLPVLAQVNVVTRSYDLGRTGANTSEITLNQSNVNSSQFGSLFQLVVDDQIYAQILYVHGLSIAGGTHNTIFAATVNNTIYAFDADTPGAPLWSRNFNNGGRATIHTEVGSACTPYTDFTGNIGIIGTPVIDTSTNTMYFVSRTVESGSTVQRLHAINITTGNDRASNPSVVISATGFAPLVENQRPSLALSQGIVYISWASFCDSGAYHGWVMAYNASTLAQVATFNDTASGTEGGIWMSGFAPAIDGNGDLYLSTGNGTFDGSTNFGESLLKLAPSALTRLDYFTPSDWNTLNGGDTDFGSGPAVLLPNMNVVVAGGKEGKIFVTKTSDLGGVVTGDTQILQSFQAVSTTVVAGATHHIHNGVATWNSPQGLNLYISGENDYVRLYRFNSSSQTFTTPATAVGSFLLPLGMPGSMFAISSNGSAAGTGILWATSPLNGDANRGDVPGLLTAYNAENMAILWQSSGNSVDTPENFSKGSPPTVANGKVYVASISKLLTVYGSKNVNAPDFTLSAPAVSVGQGDRATAAITVNPIHGFNGTVSLSVADLASGLTASLSPSSTTGASTLTIAATSTAAPGASTFTITGISGGLSHTITVSLNVDVPASNGSLSISCGGPAASPFIADTNFSGGTVAPPVTATIDTSLISSPVPPQSVFQHERYGAMTYALPGFTPGANETVTLYFAETVWAAAGQRTFNVSINGIQVLTNFDIFTAAGAKNKAIQETFTTAANSNGQVVITFTNGTADNPKIDGITVANDSSTSSTGPVSISCAGPAVSPFIADADFSGGTVATSVTASIDTSLISSPVPPQSVFQHERYGAMTYTLPGFTPGANETVTLYFAETVWAAAGQRTFNVSINGIQVLTNFDIFAAAGAKNKAIQETFTTAANSSGQVVITFTKGTVDNPKIDGITVVDGSSTSSTGPVSISCAGPAASPFIADADFSGGTVATPVTATIDTSLISSPVPPQSVFQHERYGAMTYTLSGFKPGANETVTLYFAETVWAAAGQRTFNVSINGTQVLTNFDIFAATGSKNKAIQETFTTTANSSGQVIITFTQGTVDNPKIDGITVVD